MIDLLIYVAIGLGGFVVGALIMLFLANMAVGFGVAKALW